MQQPIFADNQIYHIYNRGVEKRNIFLDDKDRFRFIHDLFEFNDETPAANIYYKLNKLLEFQSYEVKPRKIEREPRKTLINILAFCLMPNHFHLLLQQKKENGIVKFMQKLGTGYTMSFNQKYERSGSLFQGTYKAVLIEKDSHFIHLPYYIHLNPLDLKFPEWRNREQKQSYEVKPRKIEEIKNYNYKEAMKFLENYRWSSFLDYIGKKNFPSVTQREFLLEFFEGPEQYKKDTLKWLKEIDLGEEEIKKLTME